MHYTGYDKKGRNPIKKPKKQPLVDNIRYIYLWRWYILGLLVLFVPVYLIIKYSGDPVKAGSSDEPYSIFILAGQSLAAGVASYREELPAGTGLRNQHHPADTATDFWWAGSNGQGLNDALIQAFFPFYNASGQMGWDYSGGGNNLPGSQRLLNNLDGPQTTGLFGSEFEIGRAHV